MQIMSSKVGMKRAAQVLSNETATMVKRQRILDNEETDSIGSDDKSTKSNKSLQFPMQLMQMLNENKCPNHISWIKEMEAISFTTDKLQEEVLDKHFQGLKWESFVRKLNRWGFRRISGNTVPEGKVYYYHDSFRFEEQELLKTMSATKKKLPTTPMPLVYQLANETDERNDSEQNRQGEVSVATAPFPNRQQDFLSLLTTSPELNQPIVDVGNMPVLLARAVANLSSMSTLLSAPSLGSQIINGAAIRPLSPLTTSQQRPAINNRSIQASLLCQLLERQKRVAHAQQTLDLIARLRR